MTNFMKCSKCGGFGYVGSHQCPPSWLMHNCNDEEADAVEVYGHTVEDAVEAFCADYYSEWDSEWDFPPKLEVMAKDMNGKWSKFNVVVEYVPEFNATRVE